MQKKSNTQVLVPVNSSKTLKNHIHVAVRLKPMENAGSQSSSSRKFTCPWTVVSDHTIRANSKESLTYTFDSVFVLVCSTGLTIFCYIKMHKSWVGVIVNSPFGVCSYDNTT